MLRSLHVFSFFCIWEGKKCILQSHLLCCFPYLYRGSWPLTATRSFHPDDSCPNDEVTFPCSYRRFPAAHIAYYCSRVCVCGCSSQQIRSNYPRAGWMRERARTAQTAEEMGTNASSCFLRDYGWFKACRYFFSDRDIKRPPMKRLSLGRIRVCFPGGLDAAGRLELRLKP